ncbi:MAG: threonine synthase [Deltaproteobacteria bacterium]|nr:threonine synthase [Candidatus Zymogenaceae bacterium]
MTYTYRCTGCGGVFGGEKFLSRCAECNGVLLIEPDFSGREKELRELFDGTVSDMWKYVPLLPVSAPAPGEGLFEGGTPLIESRRIAGECRVSPLVFKVEIPNPTGSFKDRQVAVGIQKAREVGADTVAVISSGNVAAAASALAARYGLRCLVFVPSTAPVEKLTQSGVTGARVIRVDTESSSVVMGLVDDACKERGWMHLSTAGSINPFAVEGSKTIAYELFDQTGGRLPEVIFVPVGGGGLLGGLYRGFCDLIALGLIEKSPRLVGVQAEGCAPLVRAITDGLDADRIMAEPWKNPKTVAGGIADDILFDAHRALPAVRESKGSAVAVTDSEIMDAVSLLASREGIFAEPSGAASLAGFMRMAVGEGRDKYKNACCLITGSGLKDMDAAGRIGARITPVKPELKDILDIALI